jgi:hypothetical protein
MRSIHLRLAAFVVVTVGLAGSSTASAACDATGADATSIADGRAAIDDACPCASAASKGAYRKCASGVVRARVLADLLASACRRDVLAHAKLSICGQPGAVVCCRVGGGRTRHHVVRDPARCLNTPTLTSCVSAWQSVPTGCDASGCLPPPVCGNGIVEPGEDCDPPDDVVCDAACHTITCDTVPATCGNGSIDPGEACEPPGTATCRADCQPTTCGSAAPGEVTIACDVDHSGVGVGATPSGYLMAWNATYQRTVTDILVRRFDVEGAPRDPQPTVATGDVPCAAVHSGPAVGADGHDFYAVWSSEGSVQFGLQFEAVSARFFGGSGGMGSVDNLAFLIPIGSCRSDIFGPTIAAGASIGRFAVGWNVGASCFPGGLIFQDPVGEVLDVNPAGTPQAVDLHLFTGAPPAAFSVSGASVASLGGDTLWAWHALFAATINPPFDQFVAAVWTDSSGSTSPFSLTTRATPVAQAPSVAAGATSFLVAWAQGTPPSASAVTEIRGVRATRASGRLDPDGGLLLATAATQVTSGPVTAFDGTRWLVVWAEASGAGSDLRAVAVAADGSVVDASPRLVASNVTPQGITSASAGDGRVLVVFNRPEGATYSIRATLVAP